MEVSIDLQWPTPGHFPSNHARPGYIAAAATVEAAGAMCDCPVVSPPPRPAPYSVGWLADVIA